MIYLFAGDDSKKKLVSLDAFLKQLPKEAERLSIRHNDFNKDQIESFYSGSGLFVSTSVVIFYEVLEREEIQSFVLDKISQMAESNNHFIFSEGKLNKPTIDAFKKARAEINIYELPKEKKEKFNNFLLANAFGDKNKLNLWIYFRQAINAGVGMEELVGVLFWKAKDMILKKNFSKYSEKELEQFASKISYLLPEARKAGKDAEIAFEKFILESI